MKRFAISTRDDRISVQTAKKIELRLIDNGWQVDIQNPQLVICVGGDGTILHAVHQYIDHLESVLFVGIHSGTLGFFTDYQLNEVETFLKDVLTKQPETENKRLLSARYETQATMSEVLALNEIRVESIIKTQKIDVSINGEFFEQFRGNGLCISGQEGSTAYNRSSGGAVIYKGLNVLQMIELNGIHHVNARSLKSPLVMPAETKICLRTEERFAQAFLCYDHLSHSIHDVRAVYVGYADKYVRFAHYRKMNYFNRLRSLF